MNSKSHWREWSEKTRVTALCKVRLMWHFGGKSNDIVFNRALLFLLEAIGREGEEGLCSRLNCVSLEKLMVQVVPTGYEYIIGGSRNCLKEGGVQPIMITFVHHSVGKEGLYKNVALKITLSWLNFPTWGVGC